MRFAQALGYTVVLASSHSSALVPALAKFFTVRLLSLSVAVYPLSHSAMDGDRWRPTFMCRGLCGAETNESGKLPPKVLWEVCVEVVASSSVRA